MDIKVKKLDRKALDAIAKKVVAEDYKICGEYQYKDFKIIVTKLAEVLNKERSKEYYHSRREKGVCVICQKKVKEVNKITGKLFRYCKEHMKLDTVIRQERLERKFEEMRKNRLKKKKK